LHPGAARVLPDHRRHVTSKTIPFITKKTITV
jgi:hypothetical protein